MTTEKVIASPGSRIYSLGIIALATLCLAWGAFDPGQPLPKDFPARTTLAYIAAAFMLIAGAAIQWRRTTARAAAALAAYYTFIVVILMNGRVILRHHTEFGSYSGTAEQFALAAAALIIYAASAPIGTTTASRLTHLARLAFGICALLFGGAHFFYMNYTVPLVPHWLPPSQTFWAYATGVAHIAAGLALISGIQARLAAILLTIMYASFTPLVHIPLLLADSSSHFNWSENALNLALTGAAWVVADSLARPRLPPSQAVQQGG